ncbi:MAG TPA: cbb3-type cytochrome c oxidase subunit I, partial [Solirubrobacteraceae bacterium]
MTARLKAPGFPRGGLGILIGVALATGLTWIVRMATGHDTFHHFLAWEAIVTVSLIAAPLGFLVGLGGFDYWFYWAAGKPTRPEDHSGHGAYSWRDYFRINTDHKVIGIQYTVNSFVFLLIGGLMAMLMRAQLAQPGSHFVSANTYNGLFSVHASLLIFLFIIPVFAGLGNFVIPLMIGAPDMAFP